MTVDTISSHVSSQFLKAEISVMIQDIDIVTMKHNRKIISPIELRHCLRP